MKGNFLEEIQTLVNVPEFILTSNVISVPFESDFYAVRSSAENEDTKEFSNAGLFLTKLFVTKENIESSIKEVLENAGTCIIQKMIKSDFSGVIFSGKTGTKIFIARGLCEGITSGKVFTDEYYYEKELLKVKPLFDFPSQGMFYENGCLVLKDIDPVDLTQDQKDDICNMITILKNKFDYSFDIEFTFEKDILYCLQCRPLIEA